ncbi:MAG: alcohol dehydrogenase catalytic domain-containing protein [Desulfobacteraceae bacterium]|jgi:alcohol dehydrogenase|nr:alcohol dehydrogenase catalytic domain-containing protein [Desulfobacteraceae bacterium]
MKALVYTATNEVIYREEPDPVPGTGESLVRVEASGICGSDMHAYHGKDPRRVPPLILGHEVAGTVVSGVVAGQRVVVNPLITCGRCPLCDTGRSNLCASRELIGMRRAGAYAELVTIPSVNLIPVPEGLNTVHASLAEPTATALHALNLAIRASHRPLAELRTLVIGGGAVGLLAALLLRGYGCKRLVVAETHSMRRESVARSVGCQVHDPINDPALDTDAFDLVIDAVGGGVTRTSAMAAVSPGGIFIHIGLMDSVGELDIRKLTLFEVSLIGVYCYTAADMRAAVRALAEGMLGDLEWVEPRPLADGAQAFDDLHHGRSAAAKVVLVP